MTYEATTYNKGQENPKKEEKRKKKLPSNKKHIGTMKRICQNQKSLACFECPPQLEGKGVVISLPSGSALTILCIES